MAPAHTPTRLRLKRLTLAMMAAASTLLLSAGLVTGGAGAAELSAYTDPTSITAEAGPGYTSGPFAVHLYNYSATTFSVSVSIGGAASGWLISKDLCSGVALAPKAACEVEVEFSPTTPGSVQESLMFADSADGVSWQTALLGRSVDGLAAAVDPAQYDFGTRQVGTPTNAFPFTLMNSGTVSFSPTAVVTNSASGPSQTFSILNDYCSSVTLTPGQRCTVWVSFTAPSSGSFAADLVFSIQTQTTPNPPPTWVSHLSGSGAGGSSTPPPSDTATVGPNPSFGSVAVGTTSPPQSIRLQNTGTTTFTMSSVLVNSSTPSSWLITSDLCSGRSLSPTGACTVQIAFAPRATGAMSARIVFTDTHGFVWEAGATGTGIAPPPPSFAPSGIQFGAQRLSQTSVVKFVMLTNNSSVPVTLSWVTVTGSDASAFASYYGSSCPVGYGSVAPYSSCALGATFTPSAMRVFSATLHVEGNMSQPLDIPLSGWGVPHADLEIRGTGSVNVGQDQRVTQTVAASGKLASYPMLVSNLDTVARSLTLHVDRTLGTPTAEVWTAGTPTPAVLPKDAAGNFVTPSVAAGKTLQLTLRVTPSTSADIVSAVRVTLGTNNDLPIQILDTETNLAPKTAGNSPYDLFAMEGSQAYIGGGYPNQTVTAPALAPKGTASFTVRLRNDGGSAGQIGLALRGVDGCTSSYQVIVREQVGLSKVDITNSVMGGTYVTPTLTPGQSHDIFVAVTQANAYCTHLKLAATSLASGVAKETSYLLANLNYYPTP